MSAAEELLAALQFRYSGAPVDAKVSVHTFDGAFRTRVYAVRDLERIAERYAGSDVDTWARLSVLPEDIRLPDGSRGTESDTLGTSLLHVDVDPKIEDGEDLASWQARKLVELQAFRPKPSSIEFSGRGYYALWRLTEFTPDWQRVKRINKWLAMQLGGDDCYDVARILRLPTTMNSKPDAQRAFVVECDPTLTYSLDEFSEASLTHLERKLSELAIQPEPLPLEFELRCQKHPSLWSRIYSEDGAREVGAKLRTDGHHVDRSRNDFSIAGSLLRMGIGAGEVYTVLTHSTWFSGEKFRESGFRDGYVLYTIEQAQRLVTDTPTTNLVELSNKLMADHQFMFYAGDWYRYDEELGVFLRAEDFIPLAVQALTGDKWRPDLDAGILKYILPHVRHETLPSYDLINCGNGMLDPLSLQLTQHSAGFRSITQINAEWDSGVDCAQVDAFVRDILADDAVPIWWMFVGYCLYTRTPSPYRCLLALVGPRRTGKSTLLSALSYFLGEHNCSGVSMSDLAGDGNQFTTAALIGKLLNVDQDAPYEHPLRQINLLKKLGSADPLQIERKYMEPFSTYLTVKMAFAMNNYPTVGVTDEAFYDRWVMLNVRTDRELFTQDNQRTKINAHLALLTQAANRSAWLRRGVEGLRALHKHRGFPVTEEMRAAKDEFRQQSDSVYSFWRTATTQTTDNTWSSLSSVFMQYQRWCVENGANPVAMRRFTVRSTELAGEGLIAGLVTRHRTQWQCYGRRVVWGEVIIGGQRME